MLAALPADVAALECEVRPYVAALYADAAKTRRIELPAGAILRKCAQPAEGARVLTKPDSGGTEMCVFYEFSVDPKNLELHTGVERTGVAKSRADKSCPAVDYGKQSYPGKDWFYLANNVALPNAFKIKTKVETEGLAFLKAEKAGTTDPKKPATDFGNSPLNLQGISVAPTAACRKGATFFQGRYAACYRAHFYNQTVRGGWSLVVALNKNGEYRFIESAHEPEAPVKQ